MSTTAEDVWRLLAELTTAQSVHSKHVDTKKHEKRAQKFKESADNAKH